MPKDTQNFPAQAFSSSALSAIPYLVVKALLPSTANLATVQVTVPRENVVSNAVGDTWEVRPMPEPAVNDDTPAPIQKRDNTIYSTSVRYPETLISNVSTGSVWGWLLADIPIALYQYNPVTKRIFTLSSNQAVITFEHKTALRSDEPPAYSPVAEERVKNLAVNFNQMASEYPASHSARDNTKSSYVIITTRAIQSASTKLTDFIKHKESRNFTVRVITEDAWGGGTGNTASENIRNWLKTNYQLLNIEYVLLIGNPNPTSGDVPMKMLWPRSGAGDEDEDSPSDFYYADLTGNWDLNGNGKYGEYPGDFGPGGVDKNYEVIVGRIPYYGNKSDLDSILTKIIAYQNDTNQNWRKKVLLPMVPSDNSTPGYHLGEAIKNSVVVPKTYTYHRLYNSTYGLSPSPETVPCNVNNVTTAWKNSQFGAIFWWTHGWQQGAVDIMDNSNAATLNNAYPGFTFQCSCTNSHPETSNNLSYSLLKNGAIATVGATRVSWYYPGQTEFAGTSSNAGMTYEYAKRLIGNEAKSGGWALHDIKQTFASTGRALWMNFTGFNLYGDPEVALMSNPVQDNPPTISDIPEQNTTRDTEITVNFTIGDDKTPAADLIVSGASSDTTLVPNGNLVFGGLGTDRTVKITPSPSKTGSTNITITVKDGASKTVSKMFLLKVNELAGWQWQYPIPHSKDYKDVWGSSANDVFAVGSYGTIFHYNGNSWTEMKSGTSNNLYGVWGSSGSNVFAVGDKGTILHYDGSKWTEMKSGVFSRLMNIWGTTANDVFAVGYNGTILHYNGIMWIEIKTGILSALNDVWGTSWNDIYVVGSTFVYPNSNENILLHYDGIAWTIVDIGVDIGSYSGFQCIWGSSKENIFVGGWRDILHYNGNSWTKVTLNTAWNEMFAVWGSSANDVFVVGADYNNSTNMILHYDGYTWTEMTVNDEKINNARSFGVWGSSGNNVFAVGVYGEILHYDGIYWKRMMPSGSSITFRDIWGNSNNNVFAVGDQNGMGKIFSYNGNNWSEVQTGLPSISGLSGIWGTSNSNVFVTGNGILHYNGSNWAQEVVGVSFSDIWGASANDIFAVTGWGGIYHYNGNSWSRVFSCNTNLKGVWGSSGNDVYAYGLEVDSDNYMVPIFYHYDGLSWTKMTDSFLNTRGDVFFVWGTSKNDVYASIQVITGGCAIWHYDGISWKEIKRFGDFINKIWGTSPNDIFGAGGTVYHYDGKDWTEMNESFSNLYDLYGIWGSSADDIFAVGTGGTILHYSPTTVKPIPILSVTPASQSVPATSGTTTFTVSNAGTGTITWQAAENSSWFSISPSSGGNSGTITVTYQANTGDARTGIIEVTAAGAENSPKTIEVKQAAKAQVHFTPVWTGNPYNRMNLWVIGANINGVKVSVGDEIAVFDGTKCVGSKIVNSDISAATPLTITTSQDDGSGNGFVKGHAISFKIWKASQSSELTSVNAYFKNITTGDPMSAPLFEGNEDYGVALEVGSTQQNIALSSGWNLMSSYLTPQNADMMTIVQPLINSGCLEKVISESGGSILNVFGNWTNTIGNYNPAEGYKIKTKCTTSLSISGGSVLAQSNMYASSQSRYVKLSQGWNIISYPFATAVNAMSIVQPLIDSGKLVKVIDEKGGTIIKVFGNWVNNIGNFIPGEGYEIKVSADADWIMNESSTQSARDNSVTRGNPPVHFTPVWTGNPFSRMKLWIGNVSGYGVEVGDEIAIFDGNVCVGAAAVDSVISQQAALEITASQNDGSGNGFTDGHAITLKFWDKSQNKEITDICAQFMIPDPVTPIATPTFAGNEDFGVYLSLNCSNLDLGAVIGILRINAGINIGAVPASWDANGNGKIGMEDAVFILQKVAGLR